MTKCFEVSIDRLTVTESNVENQTHFHQVSLKYENFLQCENTDRPKQVWSSRYPSYYNEVLCSLLGMVKF